MSNVAKEFLALFTDAVAETGIEVSKGLDEVAEYAAQRAEHLATVAGEPGFDRMVQVERDNVALFAGVATAEQAESVDQRMLGIFQGALRLGAVILMG